MATAADETRRGRLVGESGCTTWAAAALDTCCVGHVLLRWGSPAASAGRKRRARCMTRILAVPRRWTASQDARSARGNSAGHGSCVRKFVAIVRVLQRAGLLRLGYGARTHVFLACNERWRMASQIFEGQQQHAVAAVTIPTRSSQPPRAALRVPPPTMQRRHRRLLLSVRGHLRAVQQLRRPHHLGSRPALRRPSRPPHAPLPRTARTRTSPRPSRSGYCSTDSTHPPHRSVCMWRK
jgi:hypothetical protein